MRIRVYSELQTRERALPPSPPIGIVALAAATCTAIDSVRTSPAPLTTAGGYAAAAQSCIPTFFFSLKMRVPFSGPRPPTQPEWLARPRTVRHHHGSDGTRVAGDAFQCRTWRVGRPEIGHEQTAVGRVRAPGARQARVSNCQ